MLAIKFKFMRMKNRKMEKIKKHCKILKKKRFSCQNLHFQQITLIIYGKGGEINKLGRSDKCHERFCLLNKHCVVSD